MSISAKSSNTLRMSFATIGWLSVALQLYLSINLTIANGKTIFNGVIIFISFFTILTNILVCLVLSYSSPASKAISGLAKFFSNPLVASGVAVSIAMVGIIYHLLLRKIWNPQGFQLIADMSLHYLMPALFIIYWALYVNKAGLRWFHSIVWCVYPIAYLCYSLIRGEITYSYPYPFIDVITIGYQQAFINSMGLLVCFILLGLVFVAAGKLIHKLNLKAHKKVLS